MYKKFFLTNFIMITQKYILLKEDYLKQLI